MRATTSSAAGSTRTATCSSEARGAGAGCCRPGGVAGDGTHAGGMEGLRAQMHRCLHRRCHTVRNPWEALNMGGCAGRATRREVPPKAPRGGKRGSAAAEPPLDAEAEWSTECTTLEEVQELVKRMGASRNKVDKELGELIDEEVGALGLGRVRSVREVQGGGAGCLLTWRQPRLL